MSGNYIICVKLVTSTTFKLSVIIYIYVGVGTLGRWSAATHSKLQYIVIVYNVGLYMYLGPY